MLIVYICLQAQKVRYVVLDIGSQMDVEIIIIRPGRSGMPAKRIPQAL